MAYGILPNPGTTYGPCPDPGCGHRDCAHTWNRARLGSGDITCTDCGDIYVPPRSFSDIDIELHESDHSRGWEEFGATPGSAEIEAARRDAS